MKAALEESKKIRESLVSELQTNLLNAQKALESKNKECQELTKANTKINEALNAKVKEYGKLNEGKLVFSKSRKE